MKKVLLLALLAVCGCHRLPPSKPLSELTPQEAAGRQVFVSRCSSCHSADTEKGMNGPGLEGLFRKPYLHSGMAANDAQVTAVIVHGRNMMPALGNTLSDQQLADLMAYLHTYDQCQITAAWNGGHFALDAGAGSRSEWLGC